MSMIPEDRMSYLDLMQEIEDLYFLEADLLDDRAYMAWLDLLTDDVRYWMPIRKNVAFDNLARETTSENDIAWMDDDKETLTKRVKQLLTGIHWAEEPVSRVAHIISNVRLTSRLTTLCDGETATVKSRFFVYRNRLETEVDVLVGRREDALRRVGGTLKIAARKILIEQSTLMAKNLTVFL